MWLLTILFAAVLMSLHSIILFTIGDIPGSLRVKLVEQSSIPEKSLVLAHPARPAKGSCNGRIKLY